ncbi:MAG TPA: response regulator [Phycisphaerae bacterium]|nr:response regulator [Phycisphaerae bacterium]
MEAKPILIVDDEKNIRLTLARALEALELETDAAINGEEALAKVAEKDYGVMLLDLKMPGMDGLEVLRRIRDIRPDITVIIITAHGTIESAVDAMKHGAVDFIQKPFAPKEIRELVRKVLDRDALQAEHARDYHAHLELAKKCINQRQFDAAREHVRQAIAADSTKPEGFNLLGVLLEMGGEKLEAQKDYRAALALDPTYKPANENLDRSVGIKRNSKINLGE